MIRDLLSLRLRFEHDVVIARQRAREAARLMRFGNQTQTRLATVVSELARRAYQTGERGTVDYRVRDGGDGRLLTVRIRHPAVDEDPDVRDLQEVLAGARRLLDHVDAGCRDGITEVTVGQRLPVEAPGPGRELDEVVAALRDRSPNNPFEELQQQNEELVEAMAALREQERERTRLLQAEREARERAQRAVRGREEILSIVSHDLRNPIGAIQTGARFLLEQPDLLGSDGIGRKQLEAIVRSAERANRLIQDLLDLSSIDQGTLSVDPEPTEVATLLFDVEELLGARAREAGIEMELCPAGSLPPVCADRDRIVQVLANLVSNALRFTPQGGRVRVRAAPALDPGDAVRFTVADTGPGVPEEVRPHLFDRFWSADPDSGGAGLGLAIVSGIVEGHGGRVWLDPEASDGATFHFTLPRRDGDCG